MISLTYKIERGVWETLLCMAILRNGKEEEEVGNLDTSY